jgi:type IV pilus assembly protein PilW
MSIQQKSGQHPARGARGFTLVELMVTVAIALFLLGGLVTIVSNVRLTYFSQQGLATLQDEQRFAMGVIADMVQQAGYFPDPVASTQDTALQGIGPYQQGQAFFGTHAAGVPDTMSVRFAIKQINGAVVDGILCDGSTNWAAGGTAEYTNTFSVVPPVAGGAGGQLQCSIAVNGAAAAPARTIVDGLVDMQILYGVKRTVTSDYNVDTYLTADQMLNNGSGGPNGGNDWENISAVRVRLTFTNPMAGQAGQPPTVQFERVIQVMGRAGVHT